MKPPEPDATYLNGEASLQLSFAAAQRDLNWLNKQIAFKDDFVELPFPRLASADENALKAAEAAYRQEANVVDSRLFRKVTLQEKGVALEEICARLRAQTSVAIYAARAIRDEKVTVFVKELPARDVMRALARLFSYACSRNGEAGKYDYEFVKSMRVELAEEEMRNRDIHAALLALDAEMEKRIEAVKGNTEHGPKGWIGICAFGSLCLASDGAFRAAQSCAIASATGAGCNARGCSRHSAQNGCQDGTRSDKTHRGDVCGNASLS